MGPLLSDPRRGAKGSFAASGAAGRRAARGMKMKFRRFRGFCTRLRLLCQPAPSDDTESGEDAGASEDWLWYVEQQQHEYDSLHFPPALLCRASTGDAASSTSGEGSATDFSFEGDETSGFLRRKQKGQRHCWDNTSSSEVPVRGKAYLERRLKEPSKSSMLDLALVDLFTSNEEVMSYAQNPRSQVAQLRERGDSRFFFILNLRMRPLQLVVVWAAPSAVDWESNPEGLLFRKFCRTMSDEARSSHLKLLPKVADGPWLLTKLVPPKPFLVGRQCASQYFSQENCMETSIDCSTSALGKKLTAMLTDGSCVLELFCILEGKAKEELPERVLGSVSVVNGSLASMRRF